jgi:membrane protease YdiL (CAAX protease family)
MIPSSLRSPSPPAQSPVSWQDKLLSILAVLGMYYGIQALTILLRITKLFLSPEQLQQRQWLVLDEHHLWQLIFALILIRIFSSGRYSDWGLNLRNLGASLRIFAWFVPICLAILFAVAIPDLLHHHSPEFNYPLTRTNILGWLSFEWLLPGPSEEILFRGLIHTYLTKTWKGVVQLGKLHIPTAGIITTLLFCLAHLDFVHSPHLSWSQQFFAFGLGIYYSAVYHRTGSLLNPILAHNFWDGTAVASWFLLYWRLH